MGRRKSTAGAWEEEARRHDLLVRIARQYYLGNLTHEQIGVREGISRIKVTRLLKEAVSRGIVEFRIKDPIGQNLELEEQLQESFGLQKVIVTASPRAPRDSVYPLLGKAAADFLVQQLRDGLCVGMGWGRTLNGMVPFLRRSNNRGIEVVSLTGGLAANSRQPNPYDVVSATAEKLGASPHYPLVPAIVESRQVRDLLMRDQRIGEIERLWKRIDIALVSIGVIAPETGVYYSFPDPKLEAERSRGAGAVGDLLAVPFNAQGRFLKRPFLARMVAIDLDVFSRISFTVGVAGGEAKAAAILGALRTGKLNTLITDERCARKLLALEQAGGRP